MGETEAILLAIRSNSEKITQVYEELKAIRTEVFALKKEIPLLIEKERMYCGAARFFDDKDMRNNLFNTIHEFADFKKNYEKEIEENKKKVKNQEELSEIGLSG